MSVSIMPMLLEICYNGSILLTFFFILGILTRWCKNLIEILILSLGVYSIVTGDVLSVTNIFAHILVYGSILISYNWGTLLL